MLYILVLKSFLCLSYFLEYNNFVEAPFSISKIGMKFLTWKMSFKSFHQNEIFNNFMCKKILSTQSKSHTTLFVSLGAVHSAPVGLIVSAGCGGRTPLVANSKAVFFILICEIYISRFFFQIMVSRQKYFFNAL